jgi:hypothetical protein
MSEAMTQRKHTIAVSQLSMVRVLRLKATESIVIYGPADDGKPWSNRNTKEDRCRHLSGLFVKGIERSSGPDEIRASPPQYNRARGGHVAKNGLEKPV